MICILYIWGGSINRGTLKWMAYEDSTAGLRKPPCRQLGSWARKQGKKETGFHGSTPFSMRKHICKQLCIQICIYISYIQIGIYMYIYIHMYIYICIYIYIMHIYSTYIYIMMSILDKLLMTGQICDFVLLL